MIKKNLHQCAFCSNDVRRIPGKNRDGSRSKNVYCGQSCYDSHRTQIIEQRKLDTSKKCAGCENTVSKLHVNREVKYCSMKCRRQHKKAKPVNCVNCQCIFTPVKYFKSRKKYASTNGGKTCSHHCQIEWIKTNPERKKKISEAFTGDKHPNWQGGPAGGTNRSYRGAGWERIAEIIRERDKYTCQDCGIGQVDRNHEVHHKIPFNQFQGDNAKANKPSNLITLCKGCHQKWEWKWRLENDVQLTLMLHVDGTNKQKYPSDLTGIRFVDAEVVGRHDVAKSGISNDSRWSIKCHKCGGNSIVWRGGLISGATQDCGCDRAGKIRAAAMKRRETHGYYWHVHGEVYNSPMEAAKEHGVGHGTIRCWCQGKKSKKGGMIPPRDGCFIVLK